MPNLPTNSQLNINALSRSFADMSESYKIFWFNGLMNIVKDGRKKATFGEIISHMIISAWYMVSEYHLNLGPADTLEKLVLRAKETSNLKPSSKPCEITAFLNNSDDTEIKRAMYVLSLNVPYRLQAPFMFDFKGAAAWNNKKKVIERINSDYSLIYYFGFGTGLNTEVVIRDDWFEYLFTNQAILSGWIEYNLILYLQRRNPNVPGIANKLYPPSERKLELAKKFWRAVAEFRPVENIYATDGSVLDKDISIDHFVPWSYVAHDELWNLVPTTKSLNSSKSNLLPDWDVYFPKLCSIEYESYEAVRQSESIHKLFDECKTVHINSDDTAYKLYRDGLCREFFSAQLKELILPAYTSAKNMGFGEWCL